MLLIFAYLYFDLNIYPDLELDLDLDLDLTLIFHRTIPLYQHVGVVFKTIANNNVQCNNANRTFQYYKKIKLIH